MMTTPERASAYHKAVELIRSATTENGILASVTPVANYQRVFARDGIICGLAGLLDGDPLITTGFRVTLATLAEHTGPVGQIPSNVGFESGTNSAAVSYGGTAGRVDANLWFIIGVCQYALLTEDPKFAAQYRPIVQNLLHLLEVWEFNGKGLLYVPQSGDWADEYLYHGYILHDQLLRIWALRLVGKCYNDVDAAAKSETLSQLVTNSYWPMKATSPLENIYHRPLWEQYIAQHQVPDYYLPCFTPNRYFKQFDAFSNALAILLGLGDDSRFQQILQHGNRLAGKNPLGLIPAFWPPIQPEDPDWPALSANNAVGTVRNQPYHYHNGGLWPMVNGWWGMAVATLDSAKGEDTLNLINAFNAGGMAEVWEFNEYGDALTGRPAGVPRCTWSAAGTILLDRTLSKKQQLIWR